MKLYSKFSWSFCLALFAFQIVFSQTENSVSLETGKTIEGRIVGGQKQTYKFTLAARQYAKITVGQIGIDLMLRLYDASGKPLIVIDTNITTSGEELAEYAATDGGEYKIEIEPKGKTAPEAAYKITLKEIRPASEDDLALQEANFLMMQFTPLLRAGKSREAIPIVARAAEIREKILGTGNDKTAIAVNWVGILHFNLGEYEKAEMYLRKALTIFEKANGATTLQSADTINNLGVFYQVRGVFDESEKMFLRAIEIRRKIFGGDHTLIAGTFNNLGNLYRRRGDYAQAQEMYERALAMRERLFGADSLEYATVLENLATFYYYKGDYTQAVRMNEQVLAIREKKLPPEHPDTGSVLANLGNIYSDAGNLEKAELLLLRAIAIREKNVGSESVRLLPPLSNLGRNYTGRDDFEKAEAIFLRGLQIAEKKIAEDPVEAASYFKSIGEFYRAKPDYEKAETYLKQAFEIKKKIFGENHFEVGEICSSLARLYLLKGAAEQGIPFQNCANRIGENQLVLNLAIGTEHEKISYMSLLAEDLNQTLNLQTALPNNKAALALSAETLLQRKGRVLDAMAGSFTELRRRFDAQDQILLKKLNDTVAALAQLSLNPPQNAKSADYQKQLAAYEDEKRKLEIEINRRSGGFFEQSKPLTVAEIKTAIPADAALIEFALYRTPDKRSGGKTVKGEARYAVFVIRNQGEIKSAQLGAAGDIDRAIDAYRKSLRNPKSNDVRQTANRVFEKLIKPIQPFFGDARQLFISSDGDLNLIPFESLINGENKFLIEQYAFSYLTGGRDLLRLKTPRPDKSGFSIIANPAFSENPEPVKTSITATRNISDTYFAPLTSTMQEAKAIQSLFPEAIIFSENKATESALKELSAPRVLHIATHGFFVENGGTNKSETASQNRSLSAVSENENPLLRSGIALAGANQKKGNKDDGILTALEASGLNLWGTKLVVLSACDTGLGEVKTGEGVYGLRRAFTLAGTESLVMSLWSVSDYITRELMTDYYKNLKKGRGRGESLREVQLAMMRKKGREHPFYWAAFIHSGEWANLDGKR